MFSLKIIQGTLHQVATAIHAALGVHVTIIDSDLNKLVSSLGDEPVTIDKGSANALSLRTKSLLFIDNPKENIACVDCGNKEYCREFAEVCTPIVFKDVAVGVIGLVAYNTEERHYLMARENGVKDFLTQMAMLIASKLGEAIDQNALIIANQELDILIQHIERAVIYTDSFGVVKRANDVAQMWLCIQQNDVLPAFFLLGKIEDSLYNQSFSWDKGQVKRGIFDRHPIHKETEEGGFVYFMESLDYVIGRYHAIESQPVITTFESIIGRTEAIQSVIRFAIKAARTASTILIQGESGTGKELFARAIHNASPRANKAFVAVNCGAIPENLLESELFGYEQGAFTGANKQGKPGKFELAHGGTLFLDEIGEMPLNLQVKLLRVLQERSVERLGAKEPTPIDVRIICATHCDLDKMVLEGEFREDLFYRIQVLPITVPPLRERSEDIPEIVAHLVKSKCERLNIHRQITIADDVMLSFVRHRWTGNIRELENVIEYALNVDVDGVLNFGDLPNRFFTHSSRRASDRSFMSLAQLEQEAIQNALAHFGKDKAGLDEICQTLEISRASLYRKMKQF